MGQCFSSLPAHGDTPERFKAGRPCLAAALLPLPLACAALARAVIGCLLNSPPLPHCAALQGRWQQGGLGDGFAAYDGAQRYGGLGEPSNPAYTTTVSACVARDTMGCWEGLYGCWGPWCSKQGQ